jgi:hypothetical protein
VWTGNTWTLVTSNAEGAFDPPPKDPKSLRDLSGVIRLWGAHRPRRRFDSPAARSAGIEPGRFPSSKQTEIDDALTDGRVSEYVDAGSARYESARARAIWQLVLRYGEGGEKAVGVPDVQEHAFGDRARHRFGLEVDHK